MNVLPASSEEMLEGMYIHVHVGGKSPPPPPKIDTLKITICHIYNLHGYPLNVTGLIKPSIWENRKISEPFSRGSLQKLEGAKISYLVPLMMHSLPTLGVFSIFNYNVSQHVICIS